MLGASDRTCSHRALAGQSKQALLLQDEAGADEQAGAHGQREADVEVRPVHFHLREQHTNLSVLAVSNFNKRTLGNFFFPQLSNRGAVVWKSHDGLASLRSFTESTRPRKLSNNDLRTSNLGLPTSKVEPNCQLAHFLNCFTPNLVYLRHYVNHFRSWRRVQETSS